MRSLTVFVLIMLSGLPLIAQAPDAQLRSELESLHTSWFKAFDSGDGAAMDQMETANLILLMPDGTIWPKTGPRAGKQPKRDPETERTLSDVSVRRFGDAAVLTGILATKLASEQFKQATTVVFVQISGKWKIASAQWTARRNN